MPEKRERTEAQKRAFERCLAAREASILAKVQGEGGEGERESEQKAQTQTPQEPPQMAEIPPQAEETEEVDVSALFNEIDQLRQEQGSLREQLSGLSSRWQQHETLARDQIRFV